MKDVVGEKEYCKWEFTFIYSLWIFWNAIEVES